MLEIWDRGVNASGRCTAECQARPSLRSVWEAQRGGLGRLLTYQKPEMINGQGSWRYPHEDYSLATISLGQRLPEGTQAWLNVKTKPQDPWDRVEFRRGEAVAWPARVADILTGGVLREAPHHRMHRSLEPWRSSTHGTKVPGGKIREYPQSL